MVKEDHIKIVDLSLFVLFILNLFDLYCTYMGLIHGYIEEANPIMREIYAFTPYAFIFVKIMIPSILLLVIHRYYCACDITHIVQALLNVLIVIYLYTDIVHINYILIWVFEVNNRMI